MIRRWLLGGTVALAFAAFAVLGCGDAEPSFDPSTRYSPESLAGELVFRYKALDPAHRHEPKARPGPKAKVSSKVAKAETKDTQPTTLDDLVRETSGKAATIPGLSRAEAIGKVADAVAKDASVAEADRKAIVDRLRAQGG